MKEINILFERSRWPQARGLRKSEMVILSLIFGSIVFSVLMYYVTSIGLGILVSSGAALLLYFTFYTNSMTPVVTSTLVLPIIALVINYHSFLGIFIFLLTIGVSLIKGREIESVLFPISIAVFSVGVFIHMLFIDPLVGPDEITFFSRVADFSSISSYFYHLLQLGSNHILSLRSSVQTFPIFYLPFYHLYNLTTPRFILVINIILWISTALLFRELLIAYRAEIPHSISPNLVFAILLISPTAMYWTNTFSKDITSVFLCMLGTYLFFRKRLLLFIVVVLLATSLRAYSIAIISIYIATIMWSPLLLAIGSISSILFVLVYTGEVVALFNSVLVWGYIFISPNPATFDNWMTPRLFPRLIEAMFYAGGLCLSILYATTNRKIRNQYSVIAIGIFIYAVVMVTVGYRYTVFVQGHPYGFGTIGDNVLRKMLPMLPLIAIWMAQTLSHTKLPNVVVTKSTDRSNSESHNQRI